MYYLSLWDAVMLRILGVIAVVMGVAWGRGGEFGGILRERGRG